MITKQELQDSLDAKNLELRKLKLKVTQVQLITRSMATLSGLIPDVVSCQRLEVVSNLLQEVINER